MGGVEEIERKGRAQPSPAETGYREDKRRARKQKERAKVKR